jgi:predicted transcriptional regulator
MTGFSLRLPEELESRLNREANAEGLPRSEIARAAIVEFLDRREKERFIAAFVKEAEAAYRSPELRQEAQNLAEEAVVADNEALTLADAAPRSTRKKSGSHQARSKARK